VLDPKFCEKCEHKLFSDANPVLCEQCAEKFFGTVKAYIEEHPDNSLNKVAEATGVEKKYLKKWIREGRIQYNSPEEAERKRKLENLKRDYKKLLDEEEAQNRHQAQQRGGYHTVDYSRHDKKR